ncbi:hypothetical protein I7I51_00967, partial [Histoplasma capsulatum]
CFRGEVAYCRRSTLTPERRETPRPPQHLLISLTTFLIQSPKHSMRTVAMTSIGCYALLKSPKMSRPFT